MTESIQPEEGENWVNVRTPWSRKKRVWVVVMFALIVFLTLGIGTTVWVQRQLNPPGSEGETILVDVPSGASINGITRILVNKNVVSNFTITRFWLRNAGPYQVGTYSFRTNMSVAAAKGVLDRGPIAGKNIITLPEGLWVQDIKQRLLSGFPLFDAAELDAVFSGNQVRSKYQPAETTSLEGLLFPATYQITDNAIADELALIQTMVQTMDSVLDEVGYQDALTKIGISAYDVIKIASIVEAEARVPQDQAKIARVIYNRINNNMRLDIDATVIYALGKHKSQLTVEDLMIDSPYNTRRYRGLPPTPISAPGRGALKAALNPANGSWLYYVLASKSGEHFFTDDFDEFNRQAALSRQQGLF